RHGIRPSWHWCGRSTAGRHPDIRSGGRLAPVRAAHAAWAVSGPANGAGPPEPRRTEVWCDTTDSVSLRRPSSASWHWPTTRPYGHPGIAQPRRGPTEAPPRREAATPRPDKRLLPTTAPEFSTSCEPPPADVRR